MKPLLLLLGHPRPSYDPETLLWNICERHGLTQGNLVSNNDNQFHFHYCYQETPPTRVADRDILRLICLDRIRSILHEQPAIPIALGWMAAEVLFRLSKAKVSKYIGGQWDMRPGAEARAWLTYDPAAALYDPNLTVDIAWVIVNAAQSAEIPIKPNPSIPIFNWDRFL